MKKIIAVSLIAISVASSNVALAESGDVDMGALTNAAASVATAVFGGPSTAAQLANTAGTAVNTISNNVGGGVTLTGGSELTNNATAGKVRTVAEGQGSKANTEIGDVSHLTMDGSRLNNTVHVDEVTTYAGGGANANTSIGTIGGGHR